MRSLFAVITVNRKRRETLENLGDDAANDSNFTNYPYLWQAFMYNSIKHQKMKTNTVLLVLIFLILCGTLFLSFTNFKQVQLLRQENTCLWMKLDSVQQVCNKKAVKQASIAPKSTSTGSAFLDFLISEGERISENEAKERSKQKVTVSSKYRLEDRYVSYKVYDPDFIGQQAGEVVLNISVDYSGDVISAKLKSATGVTNEDVIEACKKAALKTSFNYDKNSRSTQTGTITYIFTSK